MTGKKISVRTKLIIAITFFMLMSYVILGYVLMEQVRNATKTQINERMLDVVKSAASMLDGDVLAHLTAEDKGTPEYQQVYDTLLRFKDNINLDYIYYVRDMGNGEFTFGIDPDPESPGEFGSPVVYTDALYEASRGTPSVDEKPYRDRWGRFYSAFSPVFNSKGEVTGVVTADFDAAWYENQLSQSQRTIFIACMLFLLIGIALTMILTRQYDRQMDLIRENVGELSEDLDLLTQEFELKDGTKGRTGGGAKNSAREGDDESGDDIKALSNRISDIRDDLRYYVNHTTTLANNMITAMASDYRCVYYVNLDEDDAVCYRSDPNDHLMSDEGVHFSYTERFGWYGDTIVAENYREGFRNFTDPENVRRSLETKPIIAYRYLARSEGTEYYEMIRMAGVRRVEDRDDHMVHSVGLGFTVIDEEMRETMARNEALAEALALAEEANNAKTAFLSNMSHEIRTPMNAIIGLDNLALHDKDISSKTRDYLEKIGGSARHLLGLINDILDMSRIESGHVVLHREEFSFSGMLEQINTMVMSQCSEKGLTYACRVLNKVDDNYIGDDMKLKEVLINILSNSIKFTEAPGSVTMTVERTAVFADQSTIRFCIRDTGIGMDKDYIPKIFEAFSQEDGSRKNKYGSTGLGMAITKNIVEMMNGEINVESEKGVGTTFEVTVTLRNCEDQEANRDYAVDMGKLRVLIVDDDEVAAEHARMVLDEAGIRADACMSGEEALNLLEVQHVKQEPYNLVLVDWKMPEMSGEETTKEIRNRFGDETAVIVLTSYNVDDILVDASRAGVDSFLSKPLFASDVIDEFERIARRRNLSLFREKERAELAGRRMLIAEDMEINAEILMDILEMEDIGADHAENGRIAVEMFENSEVGTYDAILMDVRMPEMDGLEATAAIRALDRPDAAVIPIIALTANAFDEDVQRSLQSGMNAHLSKPVESEQLLQTLGELIYERENSSDNGQRL